jgi:hypothetical protein
MRVLIGLSIRLDIQLRPDGSGGWEEVGESEEYTSEPLNEYLSNRWKHSRLPDWKLRLLDVNGFIKRADRSFTLTARAFDLIEEVTPSTVFISYKRGESSAFGLLILTKLKTFGIDAFLDMTIQPGDDWHAYIENQIRSHDYFILLLGPTTLASEIVLREMEWALDAGAVIIPIWHNEFEYTSGKWENVPDSIDKILSTIHTIRVLEESAMGYNNAIVELLNRFGITP